MLSNGIHKLDMSLEELVSDLPSDGLKRKSHDQRTSVCLVGSSGSQFSVSEGI